MKKTAGLVLTFLCLMAIPAYAAGPITEVVADITDMLIAVVGFALTALTVMAVRWIAAKFNISIPDEWMNKTVNPALDKAIAYAEEQARKHVYEHDEALSGNEKLNLAVVFLRKYVDDKKLLALGEEKLKALIESKLNENRKSEGLPISLSSELMGSSHGDVAPDESLVEDAEGQVFFSVNGTLVNITKQLTSAGYRKGA